MRLALAIAVLAMAMTAIVLSLDMTALAQWAAAKQRLFQNTMATAIQSLRAGEPGAYTGLLAAAGAYGFVHAVGPGHGKYLIGGVGLGTSVSRARLLAISLASSLAQSLWAILLVYGGFSLLELSARRMTWLAEDVLAPASYLAITSIGAVLVWRGLPPFLKNTPQPSHDLHEDGHSHSHGHDHGHAPCGCHAHGPTPQAVARAVTARDTAMLIASIAVRPCTGAIFLLVIAWQMDIRMAGAAAVAVMGLGTAGLTSIVALSSVAARGIAFAFAGTSGIVASAAMALQLTAGVLVIWFSLILLRTTL